MKIDGMEFIDWLHKIRKESEEERKRRNISGVEWLREISKEADEILKEMQKKREYG